MFRLTLSSGSAWHDFGYCISHAMLQTCITAGGNGSTSVVRAWVRVLARSRTRTRTCPYRTIPVPYHTVPSYLVLGQVEAEPRRGQE